MKRLDFVDFWRGVALLSIIVYHFFFDLDFLGIYEVDVFEGAWLVFARFIQFSFLSVVGISTYIIRSRKSYKDFVRVQFRRLARVGLGALMISVVTYFWIPEKMIWFGILHLITASILFLTFVPKNPFINLGVGLLILGATGFVTEDFAVNNYLLALGRNTADFATLDYFPIFPWMSLPFFGMSIGSLVVRLSSFVQEKVTFPSGILWMGRNSLMIYLLHQPILLGILSLAN